MKLPTDVARNQTPIISPPMRTGASLVIALRPTGLRLNAPQLCSGWGPGSHIGLTFTPCSAMRAAQIRIAKPAPTRIRPNENFAGVDGSCPAFAMRIHSHAKIGAKTIRNSEFIDWNQLLG